MRINDRIYGEFEIAESVLIEIINSKTLQRLKGISQMGMPDEYYHKKGFSRYEHCVGVMLLLRKLGASLPEQIAGLLHDVSHTAFSHLIDWVIGDPTKENYQDDNFKNFIDKSDIPKILNKYGFDVDDICNLDKFSLLENEAPNICADRVDYSLREIVNFESKDKFKLILESLIDYQGTITFNSIKAAEIFAFDFARCQKEHWAGLPAKARYHILASALKIALHKKIITEKDFWKTDQEVLKLLIDSKDVEVLKFLEMLKLGFVIKSSTDKSGILLRKKFRYVDPFVLTSNGLFKVSELSSNYKKSLELQKNESNELNYFEVVAK